jgi:hypothetical protein
MIAKTWTLSALSVELCMDRRALARRLEGLDPVSETTKGKRVDRRYKLAAVVQHLFNRESKGLDLNDERAKLAVLQQEKLQLEIAELRGDLVRVPAVEERWHELLAAVRAKLLALPAKLAIAVAPPDRIQSAQDRAQALVHEALSELATGRAV